MELVLSPHVSLERNLTQQNSNTTLQILINEPMGFKTSSAIAT